MEACCGFTPPMVWKVAKGISTIILFHCKMGWRWWIPHPNEDPSSYWPKEYWRIITKYRERYWDLRSKLLNEKFWLRYIKIIQAMFNQYPQQRETFYTALQNFHEARSHLDGQSQSTDEILEILQSRFESLSEKFRVELKRLLLYQAYYSILRFQAELKTRMRLWQNATSLSLTKRWLNEYQVIIFWCNFIHVTLLT